MNKIHDLVSKMHNSQTNIRFTDLAKVCEFYFGKPRNKGSSHHVYKTPWIGDPRINIQNSNGKAKLYQVRQVLNAIGKLKEQRNERNR